MFLNGFMIDAISILAVILFGFYAYKKGFAFSVISLLGYAVSFVAALIISRLGASLIYEMFISGNLSELISETINNSENSEAIVRKLAEAIQTLPGYIVNMIEFETGGISYEIGKLVGESAQVISKAIEAIAAPVIEMALRGFIFIAVFIICRIAFALISAVTQLVRKIPFIGSVDGFLGLIFGLLKGTLFMFIIGNILVFLIKLSNNTLPLLSMEAVNEAPIFNIFISLGKIIGI